MTEKIQKTPIHVAVIPDGNRRWAKGKGLKPWQGHNEGAKRIEDISRAALKRGIKHITFWGSSADNLTKRPMEEKIELLRIYEEYFKKLVNGKDVFENEARINILGKWEEQFPGRLKKILKDGIEKTKGHTKHFLNFLLAYNGDDDILHAVKNIVKNKLEVTKEAISENLMTAVLPPVDLIIRTGVKGDPHNSVGFLMWQTQNSQYYFSDKFFPDFSAEEFTVAIEDFNQRARRLGK